MVVTIDDTPRSRGLHGGAVCDVMVNGEEIATAWHFTLGQRPRLQLRTVAEPSMDRQALAVVDDFSVSVSTDRTEAPVIRPLILSPFIATGCTVGWVRVEYGSAGRCQRAAA